MSSPTPLKRSLRKKRVQNYMDILQGKSVNGSENMDQSLSLMSDKKSSDRNTSVLSELNDSAVTDPNFSLNISADSSDGDGLFSKKKKIKVSDEALDTTDLRRASITLKRVSVPLTQTPSTDKQSDLDEGLLRVDDDDVNEYRMQRQKQLLDRQMVLKTIDFEEDLQEFRTVVKSSPVAAPVKRAYTSTKRIPPKPTVITKRRRSERIQNQTIERIDLSMESIDTSNLRRSFRLTSRKVGSLNENGDDSQRESSEEREEDGIEENLNMDLEENQEFLADLRNAINVPYDSVSDFTTCDFDKFQETLNMCHMFEEPVKVTASRIVSMDFHPSESKLLLLAGDKYGNIALRDLATYNGIEIKGHKYNVNCLKFSQQNNAKFYSTSLDGAVRIGDINSGSLNLLYHSSVHTTWHHESGNTLFLGEGDGAVRLLDVRSPNHDPPSFQCHKRSVRTVQTHPLDGNYFLTSSGTAYFGVWDIRHIKEFEPEPIIMEKFTNALTSAFYSANGKYVLTTGNDDTIRIFEITNNNKSQQTIRVTHNNHTGRWLSVFKAIWQPKREDCFYVGSLLNPRRMQVYSEKGVLVRELRSDAMNTVCSVITVHPTKPIIVGGNGSGKIHIYSPFHNLSDI